MPSGELKAHVAQPSAEVPARAPDRPPTAADLFVNLLLTSELANDDVRCWPKSQAKVLLSIWTLQGLAKVNTIDDFNALLARFALSFPDTLLPTQQDALLEVWRGKRQASLETIAIVAGFKDKKTADRAIQVLGKAVARTHADQGRDAVLVVLERGKGGKASRYSFCWNQMSALCDDDRLQLFAADIASGKLDPFVGLLDPLDPPLDPVEGAGGRGGSFLAAQQQEQESLPPPPSFPARYGVEPASQGVEVAAQGVEPAAAFRPTDWHPVKAQLAAAGANGAGALCRRAHANAVPPIELGSIVAWFARHAAGMAGVGPGCISVAIDNWRPGMQPADPALWPRSMMAAIEASKRRNEEAALADARAENEKELAAAGAETERQFGPLIDQADATTQARLIELLPPMERQFLRRRGGWPSGQVSGVLRDMLILALVRDADNRRRGQARPREADEPP